MSNVNELKIQLSELCRLLREQGQLLQNTASRIENTNTRTARAMKDSSREDLKMAAASEMQDAKQKALESVEVLEHVCQLLEMYASML